MKRYTEEQITTLAPNEIFVFGSNIQGYHGGGAARMALNKFGAVWEKETDCKVKATPSRQWKAE